MIDSNIKEILKSCSKDEASYKKLRELYIELNEQLQQRQKELELLERSIQHDYDGILITELELEKPGPKIVYVNQGFCDMTGYSREEVLGKTPRMLQGPKTDRETLDRLKSNLKEGKSFFGHAVNYRKDGSEFVNQWDIHPLIDENGYITHWVSYQHDVTERKRAEQTVFETNLETDDFYENAKRTIIDFDESGQITFANRALRELIGYNKEELQKYKIWEIMPQKHREVLRKQFENLWHEEIEGSRKMRMILRHKNGIPIQVEADISPLQLKSGNYMRANIRNLSLRKRVLKTLEKRNFDFSRIMEKNQDFMYGMSFDSEGNPYLDWVSKGFKDMTGYSWEECSTTDFWRKLIHQEDHEFALGHLQKARDGSSSCERYRIVTKDGSVRKILDYVKPSNEEDVHLVGNAADITGESEEQLLA